MYEINYACGKHDEIINMYKDKMDSMGINVLNLRIKIDNSINTSIYLVKKELLNTRSEHNYVIVYFTLDKIVIWYKIGTIECLTYLGNTFSATRSEFARAPIVVLENI